MTVKLNTILNLLVRQTFTLRKKTKMPSNQKMEQCDFNMRYGNLELEKSNNIYMKHVLQLNTLTY